MLITFNQFCSQSRLKVTTATSVCTFHYILCVPQILSKLWVSGCDLSLAVYVYFCNYLVKNVSIITVLAIIICPNYTSPLILEKLSLCGVLVIKEAPPSFKHGIILCWETMIVDHVYHIWINKMLAILHYNSCLCRNVSFHQNVHLHDKICDKIRYVTPTESVHWFLKFF